MRPKLNILKQEVQCNESEFPEIPHLKVTSVAPDIHVFDATEFCKQEGVEEVPYHVFYAANKRMIDAKLQNDDIALSNVFYTNTDDHTLIHTQVAFIYMMFVSPSLLEYFIKILTSCLLDGFCLSDLFIAQMAGANLGEETLKRIIEERKQNGENKE